MTKEAPTAESSLGNAQVIAAIFNGLLVRSTLDGTLPIRVRLVRGVVCVLRVLGICKGLQGAGRVACTVAV